MRAAAALLLALACGACGAISVRTSNEVRVLTFNIHAGKDSRQADNLARVAAVIDSAAADIVLLQEVDRRTRRANGADHFAELRRLTAGCATLPRGAGWPAVLDRHERAYADAGAERGRLPPR